MAKYNRDGRPFERKIPSPVPEAPKSKPTFTSGYVIRQGQHGRSFREVVSGRTEHPPQVPCGGRNSVDQLPSGDTLAGDANGNDQAPSNNEQSEEGGTTTISDTGDACVNMGGNSNTESFNTPTFSLGATCSGGEGTQPHNECIGASKNTAGPILPLSQSSLAGDPRPNKRSRLVFDLPDLNFSFPLLSTGGEPPVPSRASRPHRRSRQPSPPIQAVPPCVPVLDVAPVDPSANAPNEINGQENSDEADLGIRVDQEIADTIHVGACVGYQLEGFESQVRNIVEGVVLIPFPQ
ncbi:hypothetical protein L1987_27017 [Smallanthus sonchifolius]|uniref:Uncharacterized protein n=1 Tax=Smallanthus sonchifolius TaxID=185202 RepID=A0ACB9IB41_9ASTR|nr:hypothetical protein L1987_27017 [Smallanthus sonchifolius]